jgi:hypothetical protein
MLDNVLVINTTSSLQDFVIEHLFSVPPNRGSLNDALHFRQSHVNENTRGPCADDQVSLS